MTKIYLFLLLFLQLPNATAQETIPEVLNKYNTKEIPYLYVEELLKTEKYVVLDAREPVEFNVSHLKNAIYVGHRKFNAKTVTAKIQDKNTPIVVYCSVGVRSEEIAKKLHKQGYKNIYNLYGGIFEWKNQGGKLYDKFGNETEKVHTYNSLWSRYLNKGEKIYEE